MNEVVYDLDALCASAPPSESAAQKKYVTIISFLSRYSVKQKFNLEEIYIL